MLPQPRTAGGHGSTTNPGVDINPPASPIAPSPGLPSGPPERRAGLTPVTLFLVLLVAYVLIQVQLVLILCLLAVLFATVIERPVHLLERRFVPRPLAIVAVYLAIIGGIALPAVLIAPEIGDQASNFREKAPEQLNDLRRSWAGSSNPLLNGPGQQLLGEGIRTIRNPPQETNVERETAVNVLTGVGGAIVGFLAVLVIAFYYLMEKSLLRQLVLGEIGIGGRERVNRVWDNVERKVGDWLRGQLTLCLIIGVTATLGYGILGVQFWPLLGLWAGITEIIPIVGPWLGGVPAVIIALTMSPNKALLVILFIVVLQLMENTVLVPRVMRGAVGLTPLTVFVAILAGTEFMGLAGALLAIPFAAAIQVLLTDYLDARRSANRGLGQAAALPAWRWMRGPSVVDGHANPVDPSEVPPAPPATDPPPGTRATGWTGDLISRAVGRASATSVTSVPVVEPVEGTANGTPAADPTASKH